MAANHNCRNISSLDSSSAVLDELWASLENSCQELNTIAYVGKGLDYICQTKLPKNKRAISGKHFEGAVSGFAEFESKIYYHELPTEVWMSLDDDIINAKCAGATIKHPQVLMNYAPVSRGPWRIKALIDLAGHAVTSRFLAVRLNESEMPLEYIWAFLNSPLGNAYVYTHSTKQHIPANLMRNLPLPNTTNSQMECIAQLARNYLDLMNQPKLQTPNRDETARSTLMHLDAEVLRLYDLPPRLERELLDLFAGHQRAGVPFRFDRYYPEGYEPLFSLHEYLSHEYQSSTAGALLSHKPVAPPGGLLEALHDASEAFGSDE